MTKLEQFVINSRALEFELDRDRGEGATGIHRTIEAWSIAVQAKMGDGFSGFMIESNDNLVLKQILASYHWGWVTQDDMVQLQDIA